jgi:hypothetical protein
MKLRSICESKDEIFTYDDSEKELWANKISDAQDESGVTFDTENNDSMDQQRTIRIGDKSSKALENTSFACEMWSAGGDWEFPVRYFKCQLKKGYAKGLNQYGDPHMVFIPDGKQGNGQLTKSDKGKWVCPESGFEDDDDKRDEKKCWASLKKHLQGLVDDRKEE